VRHLADRLLGSPEIYGHKEREAEQSVNFITCHDGFTLNDLVSYDRKHNEPNGESNRDGANDNRSCNWGHEGPSRDDEVERVRNRQIKNFLTVTLLSLGMPMILMGDEVRRTQLGNNNAYCQDGAISWFDWRLLEKHADLFRFVRMLIQRRLLRDVSPERARQTLNQFIEASNKAWHGTKLNQPDWSDDSHSLAFSSDLANGSLIYLILNAYWESLEFELPVLENGSGWCRWIDTALESPHDIEEWKTCPVIPEGPYLARRRSVVILVSHSAKQVL
jgi:glycogen operon protein